MTKTVLFQQIHKEIGMLNDRIDAKILKGLTYEKEARRHKDLLITLQQINTEDRFLVKNYSLQKIKNKKIRAIKKTQRQPLVRYILRSGFAW